MTDHFITTNDHKEIKEWATSRNGKPQLIDHPEAGSDLHGLRLDFPGKEDDGLIGEGVPARDISWEEFLAEFEKQKLCFMYRPQEPDEVPNPLQHPSLDFRLIKKENIEE